MEFSDVVARRRMVRRYTGEPVDPATVTRIIEFARRGPSAGNTQGHAFVVVTDPEGRRRIAELAGEPGYVARGFDPWLSPAPVHVVVCVSEAAYRARYGEPDKAGSSLGRPVPDGNGPDDAGADSGWPVPYWWVDGGAALMLLLLAAVDEGLAAGFLGAHAIPGLADVLSIPGDMAPIGVVTIGHPAPDRRSGSLERTRTPHRRVIHYGQWSG